MNKKELIEIHKHTYRNEIEIKSSDKCFCAHCGKEFNSKDVLNYKDFYGSLTAICPFCGVDAVIGDKSGYKYSLDLYNELHYYAFVEEVGVPDMEELQFIDDFEQNKIDSKDSSNIVKYLASLEELGENGDNFSYVKLARYYSKLENYEGANKYYLLAAQDGDVDALNGLGDLYYLGHGVEVDYEAAYFYYEKSSLLGSMEGKIKIAVMYLKEQYLLDNMNFGFHLLEECFNELKDDFLMDKDPQNIYYFYSVALELANCHYLGIVTPQNHVLADFLYFTALYNAEKLQGIGFPRKFNEDIEYIKGKISSITKIYTLTNKKFICDNNVFRSTMAFINDEYRFKVQEVIYSASKKELKIKIASNYNLIVYDFTNVTYKITKSVTFKLTNVVLGLDVSNKSMETIFMEGKNNSFTFKIEKGKEKHIALAFKLTDQKPITNHDVYKNSLETVSDKGIDTLVLSDIHSC